MPQKYKPEYSNRYKYTGPSHKGQHYARCSLCPSDYSIKHSGSYDIVYHQNTKKHQDMLEVKKSHIDVTTTFQSSDKLIIRAEAYMSLFLLEHNLPISTSDHLSGLMPVMFPMCNTAKRFSSKRTKTTYIIKEMAKDVKEQLVTKVKGKYFSVLTDGSAVKGAKRQLYPCLIRYYNSDLGKVITEILSIPAIRNDSTGENIFKLLEEELLKYDLSWKHVIAFCSDNASVMMGKTKGVAAYIAKANSNCLVVGCLCHLVAIAARNAAKKLPIRIEDVLLDIMYHLKGSSKRNRQFAEIQDSCGLDGTALMAYCPTRWLSLGQCIPRILKNHLALLVFFGKDLGDKVNEDPKPAEKRTAANDGSPEPVKKV